jgi:hypothetical protein
MAKKKTTGSDATGITPPAGTRRRGAKRAGTPEGTSTPAPDSLVAGTSTEAPMDTAAERSSPTGATHSATGNGHSEESGPSYEAIAEAAYQRYLRRGGEHGRDFEDWVEAERELRSQS